MNSSSDPGPEKASEDHAGVLEVSDVTVRFGGLTALDAVSLTAAPRKVTGIIGPNGAGKTTLLNVLCGFVQPDAGRLRKAGKAIGSRLSVRPVDGPEDAKFRIGEIDCVDLAVILAHTVAEND